MDLNNRALVLTPNEVDAELAGSFLRQSGIEAMTFTHAHELASALSVGAGCLVLVEDALTDWDIPLLREALSQQPEWSDLPLIVVTSEVSKFSAAVARIFPNSGNVTLLGRPLNAYTLVSAVQVCLRAAVHQRQVGELLNQREQAIRLRDEFLAMLAHELRNPLAPMRNALFILQQLKIQEPLFIKTREVMDRQLNHIVRMVDDLMDVARLERGKVALQKQPLNLNLAVADAVETCVPAAKRLGHRVSVQSINRELPVHADPVRIEQIVSNLVNNAAKYTTQPGDIRVETSVDDQFAVITVTDPGIGFDQDAAEKLFALFMQANATIDRSAGGLGIGLTIVRRLVELHGGKVDAHSDGINKGARFVVKLPLATGKQAQSQPVQLKIAATPRQQRIVVIDDNSDIRETLTLLLTMWGHTVEMAGDGVTGIECILRSQPDVALVDIGLPGTNGYDVARAIRERDPARTIRLIALTGYGQPADKERAMQAGFDTHLLKPIAPAVLAETLAAATRH